MPLQFNWNASSPTSSSRRQSCMIIIIDPSASPQSCTAETEILNWQFPIDDALSCTRQRQGARREKRVHRINQVALVYKWGNLLGANIFSAVQMQQLHYHATTAQSAGQARAETGQQTATNKHFNLRNPNSLGRKMIYAMKEATRELMSARSTVDQWHIMTPPYRMPFQGLLRSSSLPSRLSCSLSCARNTFLA